MREEWRGHKKIESPRYLWSSHPAFSVAANEIGKCNFKQGEMWDRIEKCWRKLASGRVSLECWRMELAREEQAGRKWV